MSYLKLLVCLVLFHIDVIRMQKVLERLTLADGTTCGQKIPAYLVVDGSKLLTEDKLFFEDVDEDECKIICSNNKDELGSNILCSSFNYDTKTRFCSINRSKSSPVGKSILKAASDYRYYEKICLPDDSPSTCGDAPFFRANQAVLIGYAKNTTRAKDLSNCIEQCIQSKGECKSAMFFSDAGECIQNSATAQGAPDVFVEEMDEENVVYFENGCVVANQIRNQKTVTGSSKPKLKHSRIPSEKRKSNIKTKIIEQANLTKSSSPSNISRHFIITSKAPVQININQNDSNEEKEEISVKARQLTTPLPKEDEANLADYANWGSWSRCDRPDGRRIRKRKCPKGKHCKGLDLESQWCTEVDELILRANTEPSVIELDDGAGVGELTSEAPVTTDTPTTEIDDDSGSEESESTPKSTSRRPKVTRVTIRSTTKQSEPATPFPMSNTWTEWSPECRAFDGPNECRLGTRVGFQSRQCLRSPFHCQGTFFRYCIVPC